MRRSSTDAAFRRPRRWRALLCLALAFLAGPGMARGAGQAGPGSREIGDLARKILDDGQYQRRLPGVKAGQGEEEGRGGGQGGARRRRRGGGVAPDDGGAQASLPVVPAELGAVAELLLYLFLAVGVVFLGLAFLRRLRASPPELLAPVAEAPPRPERVERVPGLEDAERLASQGRWDEALHALLLQAIRVVTGRLPAPLPPSSTSRELLRLVPLSQEARQAFAGMVRAVELSLFGGTAVGAEVYEENRKRFRIVSGRSA